MAKRKPSETQTESSASFEASLGELQMIVSELEEGDVGLETSLARFERGIGLLRTCYCILEAAEARVEILTRFQDDQPVTVPFESSATFDSARNHATNVGSQSPHGSQHPDGSQHPGGGDSGKSGEQMGESTKPSLF